MRRGTLFFGVYYPCDEVLPGPATTGCAPRRYYTAWSPSALRRVLLIRAGDSCNAVHSFCAKCDPPDDVWVESYKERFGKTMPELQPPCGGQAHARRECISPKITHSSSFSDLNSSLRDITRPNHKLTANIRTRILRLSERARRYIALADKGGRKGSSDETHHCKSLFIVSGQVPLRSTFTKQPATVHGSLDPNQGASRTQPRAQSPQSKLKTASICRSHQQATNKPSPIESSLVREGCLQ